MTPIIVLLCTVGVYHPGPEHCQFYHLTVNTAVYTLQDRVDKLCELAKELAPKHGGRVTRCELIFTPPKEPEDVRRPSDLRA